MANVVVSLSGGKDSMYALYTVQKEGLNVNHLMFIKIGGKAHLDNKWLMKLVSESLGIPAVTAGGKIPDIRKALQKLKADVFVSGIMTTPEHMDYYREVCEPIHVKHYAPLWGKNPLTALAEMKQLGFRMLVIEVDISMGANRNWLGKEIDDEMIRELEKLKTDRNINPIGEFGEYHTLVLDSPIYKKRINITKSKTVWKKSKGYIEIKKAELQPKTEERNTLKTLKVDRPTTTFVAFSKRLLQRQSRIPQPPTPKHNNTQRVVL
jgi:diphthine-ammonia ligase